MKDIDFLVLDGKSLRTFLVVLEELSVSKAAERLGVTQSGVSHTLDKLRLALGDPLFVRSGRNIAATERAIDLHEPVRAVLDGLKGLTSQRVFDPLMGSLEFTIAANDFQRDLIFPSLIQELRNEGVDITFHFIPSGHPTTDLLRQRHCQLLITPFPPEGADIFQKRLFDDNNRCFYDPNMRNAPQSDADFIAADYIDVSFKGSIPVIKKLPYIDRIKPKITVPNFADTVLYLKNSDMLTIQLSLMSKTHFQQFASVGIPFENDPLTMYMVWHKREHIDPASQWLRQKIAARIEHIT
jgi:DNA-binding transcriptional LysR family regulator